MNRKLIVVPAVLVALAAGAWWWQEGRVEAQGDLVLHGNMDIRHVELAFNASGRIAQSLAREGDRVAQGQPLARLDTTRLALQLAQAQAAADAQSAQVAKLKAGSRPEEIRQAVAQREAARAAAVDAQQIYERQRDLVAQKFAPQQQADIARNNLDARRELLKAAEEAVRLAQLGPRAEDIAAAQANLAAQEATVAGLKHDIAEGELKAPAAGVIEKRILEPGDMASPQKPVFTLALAESPWARVYLPETALGRVPVGARATIATDSHPGQRIAGWVGYVSPTAEFTPKTVETTELRTSLVYQARVFACDGATVLRQGMPVTVTIVPDQPANPGKPCPAP